MSMPEPKRPIRHSGRVLLILLLALPLALLLTGVLLVFLAIEQAPLVNKGAALTPAHIERALRLLRQNDPRSMRPGVLRTISVSQEDLDLAANYAAQHFGRGNASVVLQEGAASVRISLALPANPFGRYLNIDADLRETAALPRFAQLQVGRLPVPAFLANWLLHRGIARLHARDDYAAAADVVKSVSARGGLLRVVYDWNDALPAQIKAALVPPQEQERLKVYQQRLVQVTQAFEPRRKLRLDELLQPLFALAAQRGASAQAALEHRAAIIVLTFYVNGKGLVAIVPAARDWPTPAPHQVLIGGRSDFPQHFTISAALAATAGSPLADAVGLYKEVDDSRGGSGFSFNDIAADRAGTRFGQLATGGPADLRRLQPFVGNGLREADFMPEWRDLPEFMAEPEFLRRYGGIGAPAYRKMMDSIERRVAALPLYR